MIVAVLKFRDFKGIRTDGLCVNTAVLYQMNSTNWPAPNVSVLIAQLVEH